MINNDGAMQLECPDRAELERFGRGALAGDRMLQFSKHLNQCLKCCTILATQDDGSDPLIFALRVQSMEMGEEVTKLADQTARQCFHIRSVGDDTSMESATKIDRPSDELIPSIAGVNLSDLLRRGGPLGEADACEIVRRAALGLHHAHQQELTHRDIKPSNLMLALHSETRVPDGFDGACQRIRGDHRNWVAQQTVSVKVTDLGLSLHGGLGSAEELTYSGQIMGTIEYMHRGLTPEVCEFVDKLMENDRRRRFQSMAEVAAAAKSLCRGADLPGLLAHRWSLQPDQNDPIEWSTLNQKTFSDTESEIAHRDGFARGTHQHAKSGSGFRRRRTLLVGCLFLVLMTGLGFIAAGPFSRSGNTGTAPSATAPGFDVEPSDALGSPASDNWSHLPADAPRPAIAPFDPAQAVSFQREWAEYLGTDVTRTVALPSGGSFQMQLLPPGQFEMGTSDAEKAEVLERTVDFKSFIASLLTFEGPKQTVFVENPVWMGRQEIAIGLFREFVAATGYVTDAERKGGSEGMYHGAQVFRSDFLWNSSPDRELNDLEPVTSLSHDDANAFCTWLSDQVPDLSFQLPTECQWEYACRAGIESVYSHGRDLDEFAEYEWFRINSGNQMHVGGKLKANPFGLFDLQGNATEWCRDVYRRGSASKPDSEDVSGDREAVRVMRGGYWGSSIDSARPGIRQPRHRSLGHHQMGFRVVSEVSLDHPPEN